MRLATRARPAAGFTLVELLVVLAIIAILLALTGAALQKAADSQRNRSTDDLMNRLQPALDVEYEAVVKQCRTDRQNAASNPGAPANATFMAVYAYCDNDFDRAQAVWTNANLRRQFPQTFAEVAAGATVSVVPAYPPPPATPVTPAVTLPVMATFSSVRLFTSSSSNLPYDESAALLYLILSKKSSGNSAGFAADDVTNGMQMDLAFTGGTAKAFRDVWGHGIGFKLWWQGVNPASTPPPEVQLPPYVDGKATYKDPLDPLSQASPPTPKVFAWKNANGTPNPKAAVLAQLPYLFNSYNRVTTVFSYGKNGGSTSPTTNKGYDNLDPTSDDRAGFRLRRLGNKGD